MPQMTRKRREFFKAHPQIRKLFPEEEIRRLADSLLAMGQICPILAWIDGLIIDGQRRWMAAEIAGVEELDAVLTDEPLGEFDIAQIQLASSIHRADLEAHEKYLGVKKLLALKPQTLKEVAERLSIDPAAVTRLMSVEKCVDEVQLAFAEGKIKDVSSIYAISKLPLENQKHALLMKLQGASRDELERQGRKSRNGSTPAVTVGRIIIDLPSGVTVTVKGAGVTLDAAIEATADAHKVMEKGRKEGLTAKTIQKVSTDRAVKGGS